jgi:hypothetical protein
MPVELARAVEAVDAVDEMITGTPLRWAAGHGPRAV